MGLKLILRLASKIAVQKLPGLRLIPNWQNPSGRRIEQAA
jgi:hypothetical protein